MIFSKKILGHSSRLLKSFYALMGCDIYSFVEVRTEDGLWERYDAPIFASEFEKGPFNNAPFWWRQYELFAFLADVRNEFGCRPLGAQRGFPADSVYLASEVGWRLTKAAEIKRRPIHSISWFTLKELLSFNYEKTFLHLQTTDTVSYADFLGERYFALLEQLQLLGDPAAVRVVFWFDN